MNKRFLWWLLFIFMLIVNWVPSSSRLFYHPIFHLGTDENNPNSYSLTQDHKTSYRGVKRALGSSPPNCEHKCDGCMPCLAMIQVPSVKAHFSVQYANYEPESWKCKCGLSSFTP